MFYLPIPIGGDSDEPIRIQTRDSRGYKYNILQYKRQTSEDKSEKYTVLTNTDQTKVFAYMAPRETATFNTLKFEDYKESDIIEVKDSIEGTMITFFWNDETDEWNICTRNGVGGDYSFAKNYEYREDIHNTNKEHFSHETDDCASGLYSASLGTSYLSSNPFSEARAKNARRNCQKPPVTFREMVVDTFRIAMITDRIIRPEDVRDLNDVILLDELSKTHCYTCILQHYTNHIVYSGTPFHSFLKLVSIYETGSMPPLVPYDSDVTYRDCVRELDNPYDTCYPNLYLLKSKEDGDDDIWQKAYRVFSAPRKNIYHIKTIDDLHSFKKSVFETYIETMIINGGKVCSIDISENDESVYYPPAWILTNVRSGQRSEVKNPFYEMAKKLRNMQPNMRYQYLYLRDCHLVDYYLLAFPQYKTEFAEFEKEYEQFVTEVHNAYVKFYIKKERDQLIPKCYFVHAARIHHNIYLQQTHTRQKVTRETVKLYFEFITPTKMFYLLTQKDGCV
jgi:hypothetical protein